ncbi:DUF2637 domain-containing protein [Subtercola vilae]|uniref:DUF2637 domain-containing protein n=1 Tax=Subtercola vilae TaxID=2056433 RepID=UPI0013759D18|nr:DUF2637 domain-containing protein [Subtercola vilae]
MTDAVIDPAKGLPKFLTGTQIDARNSTGLAWVVIVLVLAIGVLSMWASFEAQLAVAGWAKLDGPAAIAVPGVIDGSIVVFSVAAVIQRSRGMSTLISWLFVGLYTAISMAGNSIHVLTESSITDQSSMIRAVGGSFVAAMMPVSVWLVTHVMTQLLVKVPKESREEIAAQIAAEDVAFKVERESVEAEIREQARRAEEMLEQQQEHEAAEAEWEELVRSSVEAAPGSPDRIAVEKRVRETLEEFDNNASKTAAFLRMEYHRVRHIRNKIAELQETTI